MPLTARGRAHAEAVAARVVALGGSVAAVVSSPLSRCTATAAAISVALGGVGVTVDDDLVECDFGLWEGLTFGEVRERWPAEMTKWLDSTATAPPAGESLDMVAVRVRRAVVRLRAKYQAQTAVVVSHVSPLKLLLRDALGAGDALLYRLYLDPCGISIVDSWPDGGVAVRSVNDTAHLSLH